MKKFNLKSLLSLFLLILLLGCQLGYADALADEKKSSTPTPVPSVNEDKNDEEGEQLCQQTADGATIKSLQIPLMIAIGGPFCSI